MKCGDCRTCDPRTAWGCSLRLSWYQGKFTRMMNKCLVAYLIYFLNNLIYLPISTAYIFYFSAILPSLNAYDELENNWEWTFKGINRRKKLGHC